MSSYIDQLPTVDEFPLHGEGVEGLAEIMSSGRAVGVDPDRFEKHTAIGDARWAKACYEAVMGL